MTTSAISPPGGGERRSRDRQIRDLSDRGSSNTAIAERFGISDERVRQILARTKRPDEVLDTLRTEQHILALAKRGIDNRLAVLQRRILAIEDRLESERIDRLLGLT